MTKIYIFHQYKEYVRHSYGREPDPGYPKIIQDVWSGFPDSWRSNIFFTAMYYPVNGKFYIFSDDEYVRHSYGQPPDPGYPKKVADSWIGLPDSWKESSWPIEIALYYPGNEKMYLFAQGGYMRYSLGRGPDPDYPKSVADHWSGWPESWTTGRRYLNAAFYYPDNDKFYLFAGDEYVRHSYGLGPDPTYPKKIIDCWSGWPHEAWTWLLGETPQLHITGATYYRNL